MNNYHKLLEIATEKLIELGESKGFKNELLLEAPPVLWFGNNKSTKEKVVTIGANPSRQEFLSEDKNKAKEKLQNNETLSYLRDEEQRFKHLTKNQNWKSILADDTLKAEIIESYNQYFDKNPYKWFGKKTISDELSYNVEGFVNGLDASFYDNEKQYQCLHIDLMPFATVSDFTSILPACEKEIFDNKWANDFLNQLLDELNPKTIIVFGKTNLQYLQKYLGIETIGKAHKFSATTENDKPSTSEYWLFNYNSTKVIGLSTNLGNPRGFTKETLAAFSKEVSDLATP